MPTTDPVRWGVLSLAGITRRAIPALREAGNAHLAAVATQRPAVAEPLRAAQPDLRVFEDYEALLADPSIEAVYIPLPNTLHAEWAVRAAAAGKHVLSEKPMATTLADVERMAEAARRHGVLLMEGFMWRFHPQHARVRSLLADGAIGEPRLVRAGLSFALNRDVPNIRLTPEVGGGAIWDVGCYAISIPRFLFGAEPETISATARIDPVFKVDIALAALATFPGGRTALLDAGMDYVRRSAYEVVGTTGSLRIERFWTEPDTATRIILRDADGAETVETLSPANHFVLEFEHFSDAVRGRVSLRYDAADALAQIRALAAMQRAFDSGCAERPG
jgi:predicted dehydrogenase